MNTCIFALMDSGTNYIPCLKSEVMLVTLAMSPGKAIFISATHLTVAMSISSNEQGYNCIDLKDYRSTFAYTGSVYPMRFLKSSYGSVKLCPST